MGEYSTGDFDLKLRITSERNVTVDFVVGEASKIWQLARRRKMQFGDIAAAEEFMSEMRVAHPEFCKSYPIVLRYMAQMQEFNAKAFRLWLKKIELHPWKSEDEYLAAQADYVAMLYRSKNTHASLAQVNNVRANIFTMLKKEHEVFKKCAEESTKKVTAEETALRKKSVAELRDFVAMAGDTCARLGGTIRAETDIPSGPAVNIESLYASTASTGNMPTVTMSTNIRADDLL